MTKISQLTDIGGSLAANDEFIIRDVSDVSTPNKKVTSSGFIDYIIAQGTGSGFTQIAAGVGPLARVQTITSGTTGTVITSTASAGTLIERTRTTPSGQFLVGTIVAVSAGAKLQTVDGITFPAAAVASADANTLDDYEEGTFSPTVEGSSTAGTVTYATRNGKYTKTGNVVYFSLQLAWSAGTGTGNLIFTGLPFTPATGSTFPTCSILPQNLTLTANNIAAPYVDNSTAKIVLNQYPTGGGTQTSIAYDADVNFLLLSGFYQTA